MHGCKIGALCALAFLTLKVIPTTVNAQSLDGAMLLSDLSALPQARDGAGALVKAGDRFFFVGHAPGAGLELHVSDANLGNIQLVTDLYPGAQGASYDNLMAVGHRVVFAADNGRGESLWVSDGTQAGTQRVVPESATREFRPTRIQVVGDCVWFVADDGKTGQEPWRYCAADNQLALMGDLVPGAGSSSPGGFLALGDQVLFATTVGLFTSSATASEVMPFVVPDAPNLLIPQHTFGTVFREQLYFGGLTPDHGREIWVTDGTPAGTSLLADLMPGPESSQPSNAVVQGDVLYFAASTPEAGHALRRLGGRDGDIELVSDAQTSGGRIYTLQTDGERLVMMVVTGEGTRHLWQSDGTFEGTAELQFPDEVEFSKFSLGPVRVGERSVLVLETLQQGFELWALGENGDLNLSLVRDIWPGRQWGALGGFHTVGDALVFVGNAPDTGREFWQTRGTPQSTMVRFNLAQDNNADSSYFVGPDAGAETMLFGPGMGVGDRAVWLTDATPAGTRSVQNFAAATFADGDVFPPRVGFAAPTDSGPVFSALNAAEASSSHWVARDGQVMQIGSAGMGVPKRVGDRWIGIGLFDGVYSTTGQKGSFEKIFDPSITVAGDIYGFLEVTDDRAWFFAETPDNRVALWSTDGTRAGARRVPDVSMNTTPFLHRFVGALDNAVYYVARGPGVTLWQADSSGAKPVQNLAGSWGQFGALASETLRLADRLVFLLWRDDGVPELWTTDGSAAGTVQLVAAAYDERRVGGSFEQLGEFIYFKVWDSERGNALWRTDGTPAGTEFFVDVAPGFDDYALGDMAVHNNALYFVATNADSGDEIWRTDGQRVEQVTELLPGSLSAAPANLHSVQGRLVFAANDGVHGREPWILNAE